MSDPATDALIAARLPAEWKRANDPTRRNRSKARNNLRKLYRSMVELEDFKAANPQAACLNCANSTTPQMVGALCCALDSDFHGYQLVKPQHVCARWSSVSPGTPEPIPQALPLSPVAGVGGEGVSPMKGQL